MTPAARIAAAVEILDDVLKGEAAERCLTNWARRSRFAGSGDRAEIRDLVFDALRRRRSLAWIGGSETGRGLMIGRLRDQGEDPGLIFSGEGHAPAPLTETEANAGAALSVAPEAVRLDVPDWLLPLLEKALGPDMRDVMTCMQSRAPVFLRVNVARSTPDQVIRSLASDGVIAEPGPLSPSALWVTGNPRRVQSTEAYRDGLVELQDAASQAVVDMVLPFAREGRVLDYCAGGGGKALQLAAGGARHVVAHDADPGRMRDLPERARRAGHRIELAAHPEGMCDCVLTDVPCSGSGAWRRQPEAKWRLTPDRLSELLEIQAAILREVRGLVRPGGALAYATCSMLAEENDQQIDRFLGENPDWAQIDRRRFTPLDGGDGFFVALLRAPEGPGQV